MQQAFRKASKEVTRRKALLRLQAAQRWKSAGDCLQLPPCLTMRTPAITAREEIFGPVAAILTARSNENAILTANDACYGLQATLFTSNLSRGHQYAKALRAGTVSVNAYSEGDSSTPLGGYKLYGFGGKDKGRESHDQYLETKTIFINPD